MKNHRVASCLMTIAILSLIASEGEGAVPALHGTVADQTLAQWNEWLVGGIQNRHIIQKPGTMGRDWLVPLSTSLLGQNGCNPCGVRAAISGNLIGASTAIAYSVTYDGLFVDATALATQGNVLEFRNLGEVDIADGGHVLVVANLARSSTVGAADGGFMTSADIYWP